MDYPDDEEKKAARLKRENTVANQQAREYFENFGQDTSLRQDVAARQMPDRPFTIHDEKGEMVSACESAREAASVALDQKGAFEIRHEDGTPAIRAKEDGKIEIGRDFCQALEAEGASIDLNAKTGREALEGAMRPGHEQETPQLEEPERARSWRDQDELHEAGDLSTQKYREQPDQAYTLHDEQGEMVNAHGSAREAAEAALEQRGAFEVRHPDGTPAIRGQQDGKIEIGRDFGKALKQEGVELDENALSGREALRNGLDGKGRGQDGRDDQGAQAASSFVPVLENGEREAMSASDWKQAGAEQAKAEQTQARTHEAHSYDHSYGM